MTSTDAGPSAGQLQERGHGTDHDYGRGSPHIRRHGVRCRVTAGAFAGPHSAIGEVIARNGDWSTRSGALQVLGERLAPPFTFGMTVRNRRGPRSARASSAPATGSAGTVAPVRQS